MKSKWRVVAPVVLGLLGLCACTESRVDTMGVTNPQPPDQCLALASGCSFHSDCCSRSCVNAVCVINEP